MKFLIAPLIFLSLTASAQWKSYRLTAAGDTINCIDNGNLRQGKWAIKVDGVRGEPGYDEEGIFKDGKKEGMWRVYTSVGDLFAIERYRWGNKDGKSVYYNIAGPVREESWKAVNPENPYDTVDVYDPTDPTRIERKVVKIEGSAVKHGTWTYYESGSGSIMRTETYFLGKIKEPEAVAANDVTTVADSTKTAKATEKNKPKEVRDFEKKVGKKKVKVIDGSTY